MRLPYRASGVATRNRQRIVALKNAARNKSSVGLSRKVRTEKRIQKGWEGQGHKPLCVERRAARPAQGRPHQQCENWRGPEGLNGVGHKPRLSQNVIEIIDHLECS